MARTADYWQGRAEQTRLIAQHVTDPNVKAELYQFAVEYDALEKDLRAREAAEQADRDEAQRSLLRTVARMSAKGEA